MARTHVSMESFITAWEGSDNVAEVSEKTGLKEQSCQVRASGYRTKHNIPLKHMPRGGQRKLDAAAGRAFLARLRAGSVAAATDSPDTGAADTASESVDRVPPGVGEADTPNFG